MSVPKTPDEFRTWSTKGTCGIFDKEAEAWFTSGQNNLFMVLHDSDFASGLESTIAEARGKFHESAAAELFALGTPPKLTWHKKTYDSLVDKLFRINCIENESFPAPPINGWTTISDTFSKIDDIVRTTIFVGYADSARFLAEEIKDSAEKHGHAATVKEHAKEKGYYAHHVYVNFTLPITDLLTGKFIDQTATVELQVATQLQAALREVTHVLYEKERLESVGGAIPTNWKHDFSSGRFRAAYMAHSLRFIEAMIVDLRNTIHGSEGAK